MRRDASEIFQSRPALACSSSMRKNLQKNLHHKPARIAAYAHHPSRKQKSQQSWL
jgi:hypothetical protein